MFMPKNINSITIIITLEGIEKKTLKKITTKQFEQSRKHLQVEWLLFSLYENTQKLARNYEILPFEFSKIVENMKAKFNKGYLRVEINSAIAKLTVWHNLVEQSAFGLKPQNLQALRHRPWSYYTRYLHQKFL